MKKKYQYLDEKILDEIRSRVIEESENLKAEKERLEKEKVTLEALQEITDPPLKRIKAIADEVKTRYAQEAQTAKPRKSLGTILLAIIFNLVVFGGIAAIFITGIVDGIKRELVNAERRAYNKLVEEYKELKTAAGDGNLQMVEYLVGKGVPVDVAGYEYDTALMRAVQEGYTDVIEFLLKSGADLTRKNKEGKTALDMADEGTNVIVRQVAAQAAADLTPPGSAIRQLWGKKLPFSEKTFLICVQKRNKEALPLFLQADAGKFTNNWDDMGIDKAAGLGYTDVLNLLIDQGKDLKPQTINIALLTAAEEGQVDTITILLDKGADINYVRDGSYHSSGYSYTPLMKALYNVNKAAQYLLEKGADPNKMSGDPLISPIMVPLEHGYHARITRAQVDQVKLLIKYGADVNKKGEEKISPLEYARALRGGDGREIAILLKAAGAEIPYTEESFRHLIYENDLKNLRLFLEKGFDPNLQGFSYNDKDRNALMECVASGYYNLAKTLLEYGADVNVRTTAYKQTALLIAAQNENLEMIKLLLENKAQVTRDVQDVVDNYWINYDKGDAIRALIKKYK